MTIAQLIAVYDEDNPNQIPENKKERWLKEIEYTIVNDVIKTHELPIGMEEYDFDVLMREHKEMNAGLSGGLELKTGRIPDKLEDAIRMHIRRVYEKYGQNLTRAAEALDVSRNTVRKYL